MSKLIYALGMLMLIISVGINFLLAQEVRKLRTNILALKTENSIKVGDRVPDLAGTNVDGFPMTFRYSADNRLAVVYVFSPACGWCIKNRDHLSQLISAKSETFRWVAVSLSETDLEDFVIRSRFEKMPIFAKVNEDLLDAYRIEGTPQTFVVTDRGEVVKKWVGAFTGGVGEEIESFFGVSLAKTSDRITEAR